jgi:hypothetical protein
VINVLTVIWIDAELRTYSKIFGLDGSAIILGISMLLRNSAIPVMFPNSIAQRASSGLSKNAIT